MRRSASVLTAMVLAIGGFPFPGHAAEQGSDAALRGQWSAPFSEGGLFDEAAPSSREEAKMLPVPSSIAVSPDGTVMYWNAVEGYEDSFVSMGMDRPRAKNRTRVLDLRDYVLGRTSTPKWITPAQETGIGADLFCSDLRNLADGRLLVVGGTRYANDDERLGFPGGYGRTELWGVEDTRFYDPGTGLWEQGPSMRYKRWYPSLITLPDGKLLVAGGIERVVYNDRFTFVNETETFDPETATWTDNGPGGKTALPFYARLHLLPNGKIFYDASGQMWGPGPFTPTFDAGEWNKQKLYDPAARSWIDAGLAPLGARSGTFSVMLPLRAPYDKASILVVGGHLAPMPGGTYVGNDLTEVVTAVGDSITRVIGPKLNNARWHSSGVVLPSGEVIALNGGDRDDTMFAGLTTGVRQAEMYDGSRWVPLASSARDRVYHHTAVLLGDGSILAGGHAPIGFSPFLLTPDNYTKGAFASTLRDPSFEIFKPPYLFRGPRPRLQQVQAGAGLGERFQINTPDARRITRVVLSKLPSVTHVADVDQRTIELTFTRKGKGRIEASVPSNPAVAIAGHYYLFLMSDNGEGPTPSKAALVKIGESDPSDAVLPFGV